MIKQCDRTTLGRDKILTLDPSLLRGRVQSVSLRLCQKGINVEIMVENARFQRIARGFLELRHFPGYNDFGS